MTPLTYRNEYPTEPGWWWVFNKSKDTCQVEEFYPWQIEHYEGRKPRESLYFAGPITPPERPK